MNLFLFFIFFLKCGLVVNPVRFVFFVPEAAAVRAERPAEGGEGAEEPSSGSPQWYQTSFKFFTI